MVKTRRALGYVDIAAGLQELEIDNSATVLAHASLSSFGRVRGGAATIIGALLAAYSGVMMPSFTYKTMVIPEEGPPNNGLRYGSGNDLNRMAAPWSRGMPVDRLMGAVPEALRTHRRAARSRHPILSFTGVGVDDLLEDQRLDDPISVLEGLLDRNGWVLLLGVGHSVNTILHLAERRAGRRTFVRWALDGDEVRMCPAFPGCSNGFVELEDALADLARSTRIGEAEVRAFPAAALVDRAAAAFRARPGGFLCKRVDCGRCHAVRRSR